MLRVGLRPRVVTMPEDSGAADEQLSPPTTTARTTSPNCVVTMTPRTISPPSSPPKRLQYSRPSLLRENSCSQTLFADSSDFMVSEPATPAKEKTEPAPVAAPKKSSGLAVQPVEKPVLPPQMTQEFGGWLSNVYCSRIIIIFRSWAV